jgi:hypothetical protein
MILTSLSKKTGLTIGTELKVWIFRSGTALNVNQQ